MMPLRANNEIYKTMIQMSIKHATEVAPINKMEKEISCHTNQNLRTYVRLYEDFKRKNLIHGRKTEGCKSI